MKTLKTELEAGIHSLQLTIDNAKIELLLNYLALLDKWNKAYNLSAIRDINQMLSLHILDALSVMPYLDGDNFIDVGTGGGIPGLILAIVCPDKKFTLLDSNGKKTRFCQQAAFELKLDNVTCIQARAEEFRPDERFDCVVSRAFTALDNMLDCCSHMIHENGHLLAMKGPGAEGEIETIKNRIQAADIIDLEVPGIEQTRCLVKITTS